MMDSTCYNSKTCDVTIGWEYIADLGCERQEMHKNIDAENKLVYSHLEDWETDGG